MHNKLASISAHTDRTHTTMPTAQSTIALYTELHMPNAINSRRSSAFLANCCQPVNNRPAAVPVYIALADGRCL